MPSTPAPDKIVHIAMRDGVRIAAAVYLPKINGRVPALFAASPYRFDNNIAPAVPLFLWRETGPIEWYLSLGYAFVHMDVRGTGRSTGEYRYMCPKEQLDLAEVIEWIAKQKWSNGRIGGIGQSYYARMQWCAATLNPAHLSCIAPYDGNVDTYRNSAYTGGIPGDFPSIWYNQNTRVLNANPAQGPARHLDWDYPAEVRKHPTYDSFWKKRAAAERLHKIQIPVFSIGVWKKVDLHLNGNIVGWQRARGPKNLLVFGSANVQAAVQDYSSVEFHERYLKPFYDHYLKGLDTGWEKIPPVRWFVGGTDDIRESNDWPPPKTRWKPFYLAAPQSGSVDSLNDGTLQNDIYKGKAFTDYQYPNPGWRIGVVGNGPDGKPDPARRVLTFTSPVLKDTLEIAGPLKLVLYASSSNPDTDFIVKLSEQFSQDESQRNLGINPRYQIVTKGWLRASHRELDINHSSKFAPWYSHRKAEPIIPGKVYAFQIAIMPTAHRFTAGSRIRLEIANGDSSLTEFVFTHEYAPWKVGHDSLYHGPRYKSRVYLPVFSN